MNPGLSVAAKRWRVSNRKGACYCSCGGDTLRKGLLPGVPPGCFVSWDLYFKERLLRTNWEIGTVNLRPDRPPVPSKSKVQATA